MGARLERLLVLDLARDVDAVGARCFRGVLERAQLGVHVGFELLGVAEAVDLERREEMRDLAGQRRVGGDREKIRDILETSQTDGLSGAIRLTPDNHSGLMPQSLTLLVVRSGRWRIAS